jgi:hypothetical protein
VFSHAVDGLPFLEQAPRLRKGRKDTGTSRMSNRRLVPGDIQHGVPLPCDLFDQSGRLLLRLGQTVTSEAQVARILEIGVFGDPEWNHEFAVEEEGTTRVSIFARIRALREALVPAVSAPQVSPDVIRGHATELMEMCRLDPDAAMATILLQRSPPYGVRQMVNVAIVTEILLAQRETDRSVRLPVIAAALTMNIAMLSLQEILYHQREDLSEAQRADIRMHPSRAVERLKAAGVNDNVWLTVVGQHHEAIDGSGYPERLTGDAIDASARIVGAADRYCAMVSERAYRPGAFPSVALRQIFLAQGKSVEVGIAAVLVKEIGLYPPGTVVQLANGEIGVAMKRTLKSGNPIVRSVLNASGIRLPTMPKRRTTQPSFQITQVHPLARLPEDLDVESIWIPRETDVDDEIDG